MTRSIQNHVDGLVFYAPPNRRQRTARTRLMAVVIITVVAASAGVLEGFYAKFSRQAAASSGPATYFPR